MGISVLVPTYNRKFLLRVMLESLSRQTIPPDQIVVVDDGSDTDAKENEKVVRFFNGEYHFIESHRPKAYTRTVALDRGLRYIRHEYLLVSDDDILFPENYLEACLDIIEWVPQGIIVPLLVKPIGDDIDAIIKSWYLGEGWEHLTQWSIGHPKSNDWSYYRDMSFQAAHLGSVNSVNFLMAGLARSTGFDPNWIGWGGCDSDFLMRAVIEGGIILFVRDLNPVHFSTVRPSDSILRMRPSNIAEYCNKKSEDLMPLFHSAHDASKIALKEILAAR